ncbi:hypothetical protein UPYG_G00060360 [Umbra pygmaea]|uniref:Ig-like domain-containing protein n=1 Tax=Umbra pygmaea TaxID=75934 RepID=A0ABD0XCZ2_UMBPY
MTPPTFNQGQNVTLTCSSTCTLIDNPTYTWYKKNVTSPKASGQSYSITNIRSEDTGEYYCEAENEFGRLKSSTLFVHFNYGPKNTSVSVSPFDEIVEGSSVTLTCNSDANPPVNKYTWYKKNVTSPKASGQSYSITNIRSEDSGEYYCEAQNKYGHLNSSTLFVHFHYGPKYTSVSVSLSGEIVEGSSVTLTCSSDANPPVNRFTWYKKNVTSPKASGQSYSITNIRSEDSGEYYCEAENKYGCLSSSSLFVDVLYGPKNTSASVSPSGKIMEGSSVTLTCSSDANPPVDNYTWYKKNVASPQASGQSYNITNIRSEDTGEYYCEAENKYGHLNSSTLFVHFNYGPKNTSLSVSPSGEIVEGSSVTLTCSSDANPPVNKYTWYKKNVTSPKASGQSYSITNIRSEDSGEYYCEAHSKITSKNSTSVMLTVAEKNETNRDKKQGCAEAGCHTGRPSEEREKETSGLTAAVGVTVFVLVLILCLSAFMWFRKKCPKSMSDRRNTADDRQGVFSPGYDNVSTMEMTSTTAQKADTDNQ